MTDQNYLELLRLPTMDQPLKAMMSACLPGITCGYDGTANGEFPSALKLLKYDTVKIITFCTEDYSFGSPGRCVIYMVEQEWMFWMGKPKCSRSRERT